MNSKNIWIIIAVVAVIIIGVFIWQNAGNKIENGSLIDNTTGVIIGDIGAVTDDIFVEIAAQSTYYAQTDMENWLTHIENLYNQYGVTEESMNAYAALLENDLERSAAVAEKYSQRLTELLGTSGE